jgi:ankyrin repeat protein
MFAKNKKGIEALLKAGANPNDTSNVYGRATIHQASMKIDDPEFLKLILKYGGYPNLPEVHGFFDLPLSMTFF